MFLLFWGSERVNPIRGQKGCVFAFLGLPKKHFQDERNFGTKVLSNILESRRHYRLISTDKYM